MEATAAYAMYPPSVPLNEVLHTLGQGGFGKENICMMLSPTHPIATCVREANAQTFERQQTAAAAGIIGWLSEFGAVLIPTFGFFIRSKVFFQALIVKQDTMARLGHCAPLAALGFSDDDAERFESRVRDVGVFVYVACPGTDQTRWALELLRATGAEEAGALQSEAPVETTA